MTVAETPRLVLRRVMLDDAMAWRAIFCDPQVMRFGGPVRTAQWVHDTIADMIGRRYGEWSLGRWSVVEKATGAVIGVAGLARYPHRNLKTGDKTEQAVVAKRSGAVGEFRENGQTRKFVTLQPNEVGRTLRKAGEIGFCQFLHSWVP